MHSPAVARLRSACNSTGHNNKARSWGRPASKKIGTRGVSLAGIRVLLIVCFLSQVGIAWGADAPAIPAGARVGIVDIVTNDVTHYHIGRSELNRFLRTYRANWSAADLIDDLLISSLAGAGFQPIVVKASETLLKEREGWIIEEPRAGKLPRGCLKELGRIMIQENLAALIVAAPGANSEPEFDPRNRLTQLPRATQGFGFTTSDEPDGIQKPAVFDFTQFVIVAATADGPRFVARDWGGNKLYDWPGFEPGENFKQLPNATVATLRPIVADVLKNRVTTRVVTVLKP